MMIGKLAKSAVLWPFGAVSLLADAGSYVIVRRGREAILRRLTNDGKANGWSAHFMSPAFVRDRHGRYPRLKPPFKGRFEVVGFPRSGNLWLTALLSSALDLPISGRSGPSHVAFTHFGNRPDKLWRRDLQRGVIVIRDPRDSLASYWRYSRTPDFIAKNGDHGFRDFEDFYFFHYLPDRCFGGGRQNFVELVESYEGTGWPIVRYEDLRRDTATELRRLFDTWNVEVSDASIEKAVTENTKENLRAGLANRKPKTLPSHINPSNESEPLPPRVRSDLERRFADYLQRFGYA